nr:vitamin B12 dependent-methionine synthase activation domain-containing protein [Arthrobacter sp. RT-1]
MSGSTATPPPSIPPPSTADSLAVPSPNASTPGGTTSRPRSALPGPHISPRCRVRDGRAPAACPRGVWHARIRKELGFAAEEPKDTAGYFKLDYRGAPFSLGYPASPDMEDRRKVTELLKPERMGVVLSDELMLHPEQSTGAFVFHHPEAKYFKV